MPYISKYSRDEVQADVVELAAIANGEPGVLNYIITTLLLDSVKPTRYTDYNTVIGILECAKLEFYRRAAASYEDMKKDENGDVY